MANIIVSFFTPITDEGNYKPIAYYDGLMNSLKENGNNVLCVISTEFLERAWNGSNQLKNDLDEEFLINEIITFKPNFCIAFNNSIPDFITDNIECPITLWHGDTFDFFNDKNKILTNLDRYDFICPFEDTANYLIKQKNVNDSKVHQIMPATSIKRQNILQDKEISFIGSSFYSGYKLSEQLKFLDRKKVRSIANKVFNNLELSKISSKTTREIIYEEDYLEILDYLSEIEIESLYSSEKRIVTLSFLSHLGLEIFGGQEWSDLGIYFPWLRLAYNTNKVYSLEHNQFVYNSSKISVNISHSQAKIGFPWRVMDIMASNACLLSDYNAGIKIFTKDYVDIPFFSTPIEAKELSLKLLKDDILRSELVEQSQECIEARGRWESRFALLEDKFGINLLKNEDRPGSIVYLKPVKREVNTQSLDGITQDLPSQQIEARGAISLLKKKIVHLISSAHRGRNE